MNSTRSLLILGSKSRTTVEKSPVVGSIVIRGEFCVFLGQSVQVFHGAAPVAHISLSMVNSR
jgi:hypothetical protein